MTAHHAIITKEDAQTCVSSDYAMPTDPLHTYDTSSFVL